MSVVNVVIVEDDARYRASLETLFNHAPGFNLVASFGRVTAAVAEARRIVAGESRERWDLVFMDIDLGEDITGIDGTREIKQIAPDVAVVMITVFEEPTTILQAICAGADGYLLKKTSAKRILDQARAVVAGDAPMTPGVARTMLDLVRKLGASQAEAAAAPARLGLSERERDVLRCLVDGNSYKQVAANLDIKLDTVRSHIRQLYKKLQVHSAAEAVSKAIRDGLV